MSRVVLTVRPDNDSGHWCWAVAGPDLALKVVTTEQLAALAVDDRFLAGYLPEVTHQAKATDRLQTAVRRARMVCDGHALERETQGAVPVPRADVEVELEDAARRVKL